MHDAKSISDVIKNDKYLENLRNFVRQSDIVLEFQDIFPDLKTIAKAVKVEKSVLYLKVSNSVWRSELKFRQKILIDKINERFNEQLIKSVKFLA